MPGMIRSANIEDATAIHAIYAPYVAETIISFETTPPTVEEMAARIQKVQNKYPWLVYTCDEAPAQSGDQSGSQSSLPILAGYVYATSHAERAAYQWSVDVTVYVRAGYHRRNIGRGLYTALFELLRAQGFVNAYAGISLPNPGSVGIHTALGFELVGIYRNVGYKFGKWHDVGHWGLRLSEAPAQPTPPLLIAQLIDTPQWSAALQHGQALIESIAR